MTCGDGRKCGEAFACRRYGIGNPLFFGRCDEVFIDNENTILTPESVNAGVHGAVEGEENPSSEENDFSLVENQVRSRLEESGMEADDENMAAAKWLYEEDLR